MTFKEINQKFTEKVNEYLGKGYTLNTGTMAGSQGELAAIDVTDGKEIIRIMVDRFSDTDYRLLDGVQVVVGRCTDNCEPDSSDVSGILWNNHLEEIECERFYLIGARSSGHYGTQEEAYSAFEKHLDRYKASSDESCKEEFNQEKAVEIVIPKIKRELGIKRVDKKKVEVKRSRDRAGHLNYRIEYGRKVISLS